MAEYDWIVLLNEFEFINLICLLFCFNFSFQNIEKTRHFEKWFK